MWFLNITNSISPNQVGFRHGSSTIDSLLYIDHLISKSLSTKNHISILSIDFQKAFDKIGPHVILQKLKEWKVGPKVFNYIKAFLSNRKIKCKVNNLISTELPLFNGIPQGSPLSVVLFLIAFEDINKIFLNNKNVSHCLYADDLYVICNKKDPNEIKEQFIKILNSITEWGKYSGASISIEKCKHLHVCRKHRCSNIDLRYYNYIIENVSNLSILGLVFDNRRTYKHHCMYLKTNLAARLDVIKYLSSINSFIHTNTLLNITKLIIQSKIDYALTIYGNCSQTNLNSIKPPLNTAIRRSLRAFRTTPVANILAEGGFLPLEDRIQYLRSGLLSKLVSNPSNILHKEIQLLKLRKTPLSTKSALTSILDIAIELKVLGEIPKTPKEKLPFWIFKQDLFINSLTEYKKNHTSNSIYRQLYAESLDRFKSNNWKLIFTDGSKINNIASFAVVKEDGVIITNGILTQFGGVFEAEAQAILSALIIIKNSTENFVVCTDSRSVFEALKVESKSSTIKSIQQFILSMQNRMKIMWIPGHVGIVGNDFADAAAKDASRSPVTAYPCLNHKLLTKISRTYYLEKTIQEWNTHNHHYKQFNPKREKIQLPVSTSTVANKIFIRLRLGHTILTHNHYFNNEHPPTCTYCNNTQLTVAHLLTCPSLQSIYTSIFNNKTPIEHLKNPSHKNIELIYNFIKKLNLIKFT